MTVEAAVFTCSICGEPSKDICVLCTKDACANHRCERCKRCSDCCECDVPLSAQEPQAAPEVESAEPAGVSLNATNAEQPPAADTPAAPLSEVQPPAGEPQPDGSPAGPEEPGQ